MRYKMICYLAVMHPGLQLMYARCQLMCEICWFSDFLMIFKGNSCGVGREWKVLSLEW